MAGFSFVDELQKQLKCPSCRTILTHPKTLSCLHTICEGCIKRYQAVGLNNNMGFICPECRVETPLPDGQVVKLQPSSYIDALLYLFHAIKSLEGVADEKNERYSSRQMNCACCKKLSFTLVGFCAECSGIICDDCVNLHKTKKHQNHHVVQLEEFKEEDLDTYIKSQTFCQERFHGKNAAKKIYYFCQEADCQRCICRRCCLLDHRRHKLLSLDEMVQKFDKDIKEDLTKLEQLSERLQKDLDESKRQMSRVDNEIKVAIQKVHNTVETVVKKAKEHEETVIKSLEKRLQDYNNVHSKKQDDIKERKKQLDEFTSRCKVMIDKNKWELVRIQKDLKHFYQTFVQRLPVTSKRDIAQNVTVHYVTDYVICQSVKNMGKIVESVTDQSHRPIESLKEPRYTFVNDLDYVTRNSKGDMSMATRWKRTFLWSRSKSTIALNEKPTPKTRAYSIS